MNKDGDIIFVYGSFEPYYEHLFINSSITLIGENQETTIIDGSFFKSIIQIKSDFVTIRGFTIQHSGCDFFHKWDAGIVCKNAESCEITDNTIENNYIGIYSNSHAIENIIKNSYIGFKGHDCIRNIIENNNIGIFEFSMYNEIKNNNLLDNDLHATFEDWSPIYWPRFMFYPYTKWIHNYYEGHIFGPKIIKGTMIIFEIIFELQFEIPWIHIDWRSAKVPNDLDFLEGEIKSKTKS